MANSILEAAKPETRATKGVSGVSRPHDSLKNSDSGVHTPRKSRGFRFDAELLERLDDIAEMKGVTTNALAEEWLAERVAAVMEAA